MRLAYALAILVLQVPAFGQDSGPAILSRGEAPAGLAVPAVSFRPFGEIAGVYDTGLTGVGVNSQGEIGGDNSYGVELTGGISGVQSWKRTKLGIDYRGSVYHFAKTSYYDGSEQSLMLGLTHQTSRHTRLSLRQTAGTFTRSFGLLGLSQTVLFDPSSSYIPTTDFFDNRTLYVSSQADFAIQRSTRLSFNIGGDWFLNRRRSSALYGVAGAAARGDVQYRVSRRSTIGAGYSYTHYKYHGVFSGTDTHSAVGTYAIRLTRTVELTAYGGFMRSETKFLQNVPIDPIIAAIIGRATGTIIVHRIDYIPNVSARFSRAFRQGVAHVSAGRSVTPGNGLFLTSTMTSVAGGYSYTGLRRWTFNTLGAYNRSRSIGNVIGEYRSTSAGVSVARKIGEMLHLVGSLQGRKYQSGDFDKYNRIIYTVRVGLGFTPGEIPLRIW